MKVACLVPVRNKAYFVGHTVDSVLDQTYEGMEILLSDQGSTDGSLSVLKYKAATYRGENTVRVLECPDTEPTGLAGYNAHINWLLKQTDADLLVIVSADDLCHPDRVKRTVEVYQELRPAFIGTKMQFLKPTDTDKLEVEGITAFDPKGSRFVTGREHIEQLVGGSVSTAYDREFYEKTGGCTGPVVADVYLPFLATLDRGFYIIDEQLFAYVRHKKQDNAGLGGRLLAAENDDETLILNELANYQIVTTLFQAGRVAASTYTEKWGSESGMDSADALYQNIVARTNDWAQCRDLMNQRGLRPRLL